MSEEQKSKRCYNCDERFTSFTCDECGSPFCCYCLEKHDEDKYFCGLCAKKIFNKKITELQKIIKDSQKTIEEKDRLYEMRDATDEMYVSVGIFHSLEEALEVLNNNDADAIGLVSSSDSYACIEIHARGYGLDVGKMVFAREYEQVYDEESGEGIWKITSEVRKE